MWRNGSVKSGKMVVQDGTAHSCGRRIVNRMDYLPRVVDEEPNELLSELPAISLEGPRGARCLIKNLTR